MSFCFRRLPALARRARAFHARSRPPVLSVVHATPLCVLCVCVCVHVCPPSPVASRHSTRTQTSSLWAYWLRFLRPEDHQLLFLACQNQYSIEFEPYDWGLNSQAAARRAVRSRLT
jgi:hypothetical protein